MTMHLIEARNYSYGYIYLIILYYSFLFIVVSLIYLHTIPST